MEIGNIRLSCKSPAHLQNNSYEAGFILFHTPVVIIVNEKEYTFDGSSAVIFTADSRKIFHSAYQTLPRYDYIELKLTSSDKQYLSSEGLPINIPLAVSDDYIISSLIKCMKEQTIRNKTIAGGFMELTMRAVLAAVCVELQADRHSGTSASVIPHIAELRSLRESVYEAPMNQWIATECANDIGVSRTYFHKLYLMAFGVTFLHDIIESRLTYASELLETTSLSVNAIAEKCGYENDSYFMRQFKKHRGCTPTEYRNSERVNIK